MFFLYTGPARLANEANGVSMRANWCGALFAVLGGISSPALGDVELKVGETKIVGNRVQGVALDNPRIADVHMLKDARVEVAAKEGGEATISLYTADGKLQIQQLRVVSDRTSGAQTAATGTWISSRFGGSKIPNARCAEPLEDEGAASALQDARDLLRQELTQDAIRTLEHALRLEPDAAVLHLYLGAAWAKLNNEAKGAASYETYVLSCPEGPEAKAVIRLLRELERRSSSHSER